MKKSIFILLCLYFISFSDENNSKIEIKESSSTNCFPKIDLELTFFYKVKFDSDKNIFEIQKEKISLSDHLYGDDFQSLEQKKQKKKIN